MCRIAQINLVYIINYNYHCVIIHSDMSDFEKKQVEADLKRFTTINFVRPSECRNADQIRFYVRELCVKIEDLERRFNYVPEWAYALLAQYNAIQNSLVLVDFRNSYR